MLERLELTAINQLSQVAAVNSRFMEFAEQFALPKTVTRAVCVALDEILNNTISYAHDDDAEHEIEVAIELGEKHLTVTITDDGAPFNPFDCPPPNIEQSLEEREVGGLGIHLVRNVMSNVSYSRQPNKNVVTLVKRLSEGDDE